MQIVYTYICLAIFLKFMLRSLIKQSPVLFFGLITYFITFTIIILLYNKVSIFYFVNSHFNSFFDQFFYYVTALGNGWTYLIIMLAMPFIRFRYLMMFISALCIKTIMVQSLKHLIFPDHLRPYELFGNINGFHSVKGVDLLHYFSFPSGHSASIFCLAVLLSLIIKNIYLTLFFIIIAIVSGYSRMYLSQHFSVDVYAGSIIGILTAYLSYWYFNIKPSAKLNRIDWIDHKISF
jgi:membrane-associated phospholipid phosphatase